MIRVRFANGVTVQYNSGYYVEPWNGGALIKDKQGGVSIALVTACSGAIIEWTPPCAVFNAVNDLDGYRLSTILSDIGKIKAKITKLSTAERRRRG